MRVFDVHAEQFWPVVDLHRKENGVSERELSRRIGKSEPYLANMRRKGAVPSLDIRIPLSRVLGVDLTFRHTTPIAPRLAGRETAQAPGVMDMIRWLRRRDGRLDMTDPMMTRVEIFTAPRRGQATPEPVHMGAMSLTAQALGISTVEELKQIFAAAPEEVNRTVLSRHRKAMKGEPEVAFRQVTHHPKEGEVTVIEYLQLLHRVTDPAGQSRVLNYALPL